MRVLFITSYNLTTNPRLAKELSLAEELGWQTEFVGFDMGGWSNEIEQKEATKFRAKKIYLSARRRPMLQWFCDVLCEQLARLIYPVMKRSLKITVYASNRRSRRLWKYLSKIRNEKYDLIVAHNLAALYPAYRFARKHKIPFGFDVEDYHPGEAISKDVRNEKRRREQLMKRLLPEAAYISVASPLIGEMTLKLIGKYPRNRLVLINNVFPAREFVFVPPQKGKVRFVWFSQNIASGRGLEFILPVLALFKDEVEVHLIGNPYPHFYKEFLDQYSDFVKIHSPLSQADLHRRLCEFDIGLALEPGKDKNNEIALSNKIWAYLQAGLYILATDTPAQKLFIDQFSSHGEIIPQDKQQLYGIISRIIEEIDFIRSKKNERFQKAQSYSWDNEKKKLAEIWRSL